MNIKDVVFILSNAKIPSNRKVRAIAENIYLREISLIN